MKETYLLSSPQEVELYPVKNGTDVILRKNIQEVTITVDDQAYEAWECDEAQFRFPGTITKEELWADFDYWFDHGPTYTAQTDVNLTLEDARAAKYAEISAACEAAIYAGIDVQLSTGTEHFSLTEKDQINLFGKQAQLTSGAEKVEYHSDGNPCKYYSAADMLAIINAAFSYVSYSTTYCNALNMWIKDCAKRSELDEIAWGADIPEAYRNEVLMDYLARLTGEEVADEETA